LFLFTLFYNLLLFIFKIKFKNKANKGGPVTIEAEKIVTKSARGLNIQFPGQSIEEGRMRKRKRKKKRKI